MRSSFFSVAGLAAACIVVACGRTNIDSIDFPPNSSGGSGGEGASGGTAGFGGSGGGVGGAGNAGATGGTGGISSSSSSGTGAGPVFICGDGLPGPEEECDDGNGSNSDACVYCGFAKCGDGYVWFGVEQCDDANANTSDACPFCQKAFCGDGFLFTGFEQCDDGNFVDGDGCSSKCMLPSCGNGIPDPGEQCDDGNPSPNDDCISCVKATCGDGFVWTGVEQCDDGNVVDGDGCSSKCTVTGCGNGFVEPGEQCDDGNSSPNDSCVSCANATCGDKFVWTGVEECDDGNSNNGDGCSSQCLLPKCGDGTVDPGEQCDDGNQTNGDGCSSTCMLPVCGDGFVDPNEVCDLGAQNADRPALIVKQGSNAFAVRPVDRSANAVTFYAYGSASSHTGYEVLQGSRIFFYRDTTTGSLNLVFHHGIDFNSSGQSQPKAQVTWTMSGLPSTVVVLVADDGPNELAKSSPTTMQAKWSLQNNSDGGAIGTFSFPGNFTVTIAPTFSAGINSWAWINGDEVQTSLDLGQTVEITAFSTPAACRLDCTVPGCGDGILDGGEVCDDGNTTGGDGCAANCGSLN